MGDVSKRQCIKKEGATAERNASQITAYDDGLPDLLYLLHWCLSTVSRSQKDLEKIGESVFLCLSLQLPTLPSPSLTPVSFSLAVSHQAALG